MSKIGKKPIEIPNGVEVTIKDGIIKVKGPKGELAQTYNEGVSFKIEDKTITVSRDSDIPQHRAYHGLYRSLINNMVVGTSQGFTKKLELVGTGYRAQLKGKVLNLALGFSHPVDVQIPEDVECKLDGNTKIELTCIDKQKVGQLAANIRKIRPPEPYKGKGVKYHDEKIRRKAGKAAK